MGELAANDRDRLIGAINERADRHGVQAWQWIQELHRTSVTIAALGTDAHIDTITAFWIKLHGVLVEIGASYEHLCDLAGPSASTIANDARAVRDAIHAVRDSMNEDELIWLHYRRDVECHVWQSAYELNRRGDRLKEMRAFALLGGKQLTVDEFDRRATALVRKFKVDEPAIAVHFAKLVVPHAARLLDVFRPLVEG